MSEIIKVSAIVLNSKQCNVDAARDLELFSPEMGKFFARIRGVEKPKAKLAVAAQPFCFGEFSLAQRGGRYTVTDCFVQDSFYELAYNFDGFVLGSAMLEITSKLTLAGDSNFQLFKLLLNCLKVIVYEKAEPSAVFIKFIDESMKISGFGLDFSVCDKCGKSLKDQKTVNLVYVGLGAVCNECIRQDDSIRIDASEWTILNQICNNPLDNIKNLPAFLREKLNSVLKLLIRQFYFRTGEKIKSLDKYF